MYNIRCTFVREGSERLYCKDACICISVILGIGVMRVIEDVRECCVRASLFCICTYESLRTAL